MAKSPIDIWDPATFDAPLTERLADAADLIVGYFETSSRHLRERERSDHRGAYPTNPFAADFLAFQEQLAGEIGDRIVRAWHYTRLTDDEVAAMRREGVGLSTLDSIRRRLDTQVANGVFSAEVAASLFAASPFHGSQHEARAGRFWTTSVPRAIDDGGVEPLLGSWGGEAVAFWQEDEALQKRLAAIGRPCVVELAVPIAATDRAYNVSCGLVAAFAATLGQRGDGVSFDLCVNQPLGPDAILAIHSEGDGRFERIARGYPIGFQVDED